MIIIVGLGNPGIRYSFTRHNCGFLAVSDLTEHLKINLSYNKRFNSRFAISVYKHYKLVFVQPYTFMNLSGTAIKSLLFYFKVEASNLYVIHDDINLEIGKVRVKFSGGSGGHNGLKSIDDNIGNEYNRIRIGIGKPYCTNLADYVLQNFTEVELKEIYFTLNKIKFNLDLIIEGKIKNL